MNQILTVTQIAQAEKRGTVLLSSATTEEKKQPEIQVAVSFNDPHQAAQFVHGKKYSVTITIEQ